MGKRAFDVVVATVSLVLLSPIMLAAAICVRLGGDGPILYRQVRVGRDGKPFEILKFRSMQHRQPVDARLITAGSDPRITRVGRVLRRWKLDELPQLLNVLRGEMSIVGPRPEVPKYVEQYPAAAREKILSVNPGITDIASIEFRHEEKLLARADDPERVYVDEILPRKVALYEAYVDRHSLLGDIHILLRTCRSLFSRGDAGGKAGTDR